jgi:hypothetical protein
MKRFSSPCPRRSWGAGGRVKLLLDCHVLLWALLELQKL